jgi:hypothetical protein
MTNERASPEPRASSVTPPEGMDEAAFHAARDALVTDIVQVRPCLLARRTISAPCDALAQG